MLKTLLNKTITQSLLLVVFLYGCNSKYDKELLKDKDVHEVIPVNYQTKFMSYRPICTTSFFNNKLTFIKMKDSNSESHFKPINVVLDSNSKFLAIIDPHMIGNLFRIQHDTIDMKLMGGIAYRNYRYHIYEIERIINYLKFDYNETKNFIDTLISNYYEPYHYMDLPLIKKINTKQEIQQLVIDFWETDEKVRTFYKSNNGLWVKHFEDNFEDYLIYNYKPYALLAYKLIDTKYDFNDEYLNQFYSMDVGYYSLIFEATYY